MPLGRSACSAALLHKSVRVWLWQDIPPVRCAAPGQTRKEGFVMKLVLASGSPRRSELLRAAGYEFEVCPSGANEDIAPVPPRLYTQALAEKKAAEVLARAGGGRVVVGADTVVFVGGRILGKPLDGADAVRMLELLSGRAHEVFTGVSVAAPDGTETFCERTVVQFFPLNRGMIARYVATGQPLDKAGAYGIQGPGSLLVERIEGDYYNVMGLPIGRLSRILETKFGILPVPRGAADANNLQNQ